MSESRAFVTTGRGLDRSSVPMRLWEKAKRLGVWDPAAIDLRRDAEDWARLDEVQRDVLLRLAALFVAGEESVTLDLLPLIGAVAAEGRLEEEMYLTTFLFEEAKHVEVFSRFFDEVAGERAGLERFHGPAWRRLFEFELPSALGRLRDDRSPEALARASVTYNMVVEGMLAETGYRAYHAVLDRHDLMPGMREAVALVKRDESRHLAYGTYLLSRLLEAHGEPVWRAIERRFDELVAPALGVVNEIFACYESMPFDLSLEEFVGHAMSQFQSRFARLEAAARGAAPELDTP